MLRQCRIYNLECRTITHALQTNLHCVLIGEQYIMKKKFLQFVRENKEKLITAIGTVAVGLLVLFLNSCASAQRIQIQQEIDGVKQETIIESDTKINAIALAFTTNVGE